jgi:predicted RNase H-like nuclease (RuvC/YqgF family)
VRVTINTKDLNFDEKEKEVLKNLSKENTKYKNKIKRLEEMVAALRREIQRKECEYKNSIQTLQTFKSTMKNLFDLKDFYDE